VSDCQKLLLKSSKRRGAKAFRAAVATDAARNPRPVDMMIDVHRKHNNKSDQDNFSKFMRLGFYL